MIRQRNTQYTKGKLRNYVMVKFFWIILKMLSTNTLQYDSAHEMLTRLHESADFFYITFILTALYLYHGTQQQASQLSTNHTCFIYGQSFYIFAYTGSSSQAHFTVNLHMKLATKCVYNWCLLLAFKQMSIGIRLKERVRCKSCHAERKFSNKAFSKIFKKNFLDNGAVYLRITFNQCPAKQHFCT